MLEGTKSPEELQDIELALVGLRGGEATDRALVAQLRRFSTDVKSRLFLVLARRGARLAVSPLLEEAASSDTAIAQAAFQTLGKIAACEDLPALLERLVNLKAAGARAEAESAAVRTLARIANVSQGSEIVRAALAKSPDLEARCSLLRLLPYAGDTYALIVLGEARRDQEPRIRDAAVRALAAWPDSFPWRALLTIFYHPENDTHRSLALRALARMAVDRNAKPNAELIGDYRRLLAAARDDNERKLILSALAGAAHPGALDLAVSLLPKAGVRAEAELAIRKIAETIQAQHPKAAQAALERLKQVKP
jgi:hypothetical protein